MANLNKVMMIGRLTRDPEIRTFANGGKVASIGFAVNNRKRNQQSGEWEDVPVFVDVKAFNREKGRQLADLVEQYLHKGNQVYFEGHLQLDQWTSQDGQKRSKLLIILDDVQFLEPRGERGSSGPSDGANRYARSAPPRKADASAGSYEDGPPDEPMPPHSSPGGGEEEIPF